MTAGAPSVTLRLWRHVMIIERETGTVQYREDKYRGDSVGGSIVRGGGVAGGTRIRT